MVNQRTEGLDFFIFSGRRLAAARNKRNKKYDMGGRKENLLFFVKAARTRASRPANMNVEAGSLKLGLALRKSSKALWTVGTISWNKEWETKNK